MHLIRLFLNDFDKGGIIMWVIFFVTIVSWMTGIQKLTELRRFSFARKKFLKRSNSLFCDRSQTLKPTGFDNYDYLLIQLKNSLSANGTGSKGIVREFLIGTVPYLERHFSTMSVWISIAPLLGLLGTVIGMIETFRIIMDFGVGNPSLTAEGISVALLTTQAGLTSAFPALIFHNYLSSKKDALISSVLKDCEQIINNINDSVKSTKD